ncbi:MAG: threonine synthase [Chloroflexota bacterium]
MSHMTHLECSRCGEKHAADQVQGLCRKCGGPLLARYDLDALARSVKKSDLAGRVSTLWRYREFLPVSGDDDIITLGEGMTPLLPARRLGREIGCEDLLIKDEGLNPTGSFKARGASVGISMCKELGIEAIAMPTAGNAGGAWASYARRAGIAAHIAMPKDAPAMAMKECLATGAHVYLVDGLISDAGKLIGTAAKHFGWFDAATLKEPYRIEGKKTMGLELAEQLDWELPDVVVYPTGGGVGLIGMMKAFAELEAIGWIGKKRPRMISVQAEGCAPIVKAFEAGRDESEFFQNAATIAGGLRVPKALGDFLVLRYVRETDGVAIAVSDAEIRKALQQTGSCEGMFVSPEGAAGVAAVAKLRQQGKIAAGEKVVIYNTGTGLKYPEMVEVDLPVYPVNDPEILIKTVK